MLWSRCSRFFLIFNSSSLSPKHFETFLSAPIIIGITVTLMFQSFFSYLEKSKHFETFSSAPIIIGITVTLMFQSFFSYLEKSKHFETFSSAPIIIGITVTLMFQSFFSYLEKSKHFETFSSALIIIGITVTLMFQSFFSYLEKSKYFSLNSVSFFVHWDGKIHLTAGFHFYIFVNGHQYDNNYYYYCCWNGKTLEQRQSELDISGKIKSIVTTAFLKSARILGRARDIWADLLSLRLQWNTTISSWCEKLQK